MTIAEAEASGSEMMTAIIPAEPRLVESLHYMLTFLDNHDKDDSVRLGEPSATFRYGYIVFGGVWWSNNREDKRLYAQIEMKDGSIWTTPLYTVTDFFLLMQEV